MGRVLLALVSTLFLVVQVMAGTWTTNNFLYKPATGARGEDEKAKFDSGLNRVDSRLANEKWLNDSLYSGDLGTAITTIGSAKTVLSIPAGSWPIAANLTVPANLTLKLAHGAVLTIATGKTLTINGPLEAGRYQIFSWNGTGTVAYGNLVPEVYPEWYGAIPDNSTDSVIYLQKALDTHTVLHLGRGIYKITTELYPKEGGTIYGEGPQSIIYRSTTAGGTHKGGLLPYNYVTLRNFTLRGSGAVYVGGADGIIVLYDNGGWVSPGFVTARNQTDMTKWRGAHLNIENVIFENWAANGVEAGPFSTINNVIVKNTLNEGMLLQGDHCQIINPTVLNTLGWGIDINASYTQVLGGLVYNCGDFSKYATDCGGIIIASHTQAAGTVGNKIIGTTVDTSDCFGVLVYAPTSSDYSLTDTTLADLTIKNVNAASTDVNAGAIGIVDNSTSGTKVDRVQINNVIVDTTTVGHGISILGAKNINIDNYHIKSVAAKGIFIYPGVGNFEGINIGKGTIKTFGPHGIYATGGTKLNIEGYNISGSTAVAAYQGILLTNVTKFNIGQGIIDLDTTNGYGIFLTGSTGHGNISGANIANCLSAIYYDGTGDYVTVNGNDLSDTNTNKVHLGGTRTNSRAYNNLGVELPTYADNAAALAGGLIAGDRYRTSTGAMMQVY
ncbi:MAG: right-handed parallel beta-helix repeat-containing protein [Proteobacteria bacterium]|nr:right-handed parallel beta-helix repeat-containing protein [Pseudomonadota bacterium]